MTQNKNKKGIAKKALSISLVAAMLATSNVPVWASGFEAVDPEVEGFALEESVAEEPVVEAEVADDFEDVTVGQAEDNEAGYNSTIQLQNNGWGSEIGVSGEIWAGNSTNGTKVKKYNYAWYVNDKQVYPANGGYASAKNGSESIIKYTPTYADFGKSVSLRVLSEDANQENLFDYTITVDNISAYDISSMSASQFWMLDPETPDKAHEIADGGTVSYRGKNIKAAYYVEPFWVDDQKLTTDDFIVSYDSDSNNNFIDAGSTITVTLEPSDEHYKGKFVKSYKIGKASWEDFQKVVERDINKDVSYEYTGKPIKLGMNDFSFIDTANDRNQDLKDAIVDVRVTDNSYQDDDHYTPAKNYYYAAVVVDPDKINNYDISGARDYIYDGENFKLIGLIGTYSIEPRDLSKCTIKIDPLAVKDKSIGDNDAQFINKVHVYDAAGKELDLIYNPTVHDYWVKVGSNNGKGTFNATIMQGDTGCTTNQKDTTFQVIAANFDNVEFKNMDKVTASVPYTGEDVTKDISSFGVLRAVTGLTVNGTNVVDENDYTVSFEGKDAGTGYVVITGKNNYEGAVKKFPFQIIPANVTAKDVSVATKVVYNPVYTKASQYAPSVLVKAYNTAKPAKEFVLEEGKDYTVSYSFTDGENKLDKRITTKVRITNPNFRGGEKQVEKTGATTISKKQFGDLEIVLNKASYTYTGGVILPDVTITDGDDVLVEGIDYTISANGTNVGKYTATIRGKGTYDAAASTTVAYEITPADMKDVKVSIADVVYNGKIQKPTTDNMTFTLNGKKVSAAQFKVAYPDPSKNTNAGKGLVRLSSRTDNFIGTADTEFTIKPATITGTIKVYDKSNNLLNISPATTFKYDGKEHTFDKVTFTPTGTLAKYVTDNDWEVKYIDNKYGTKAYVAIIAKNNFAGAQIITNAEGSAIKNVVDYKQFTVEKYTLTKQHVFFGDAEYAGGATVTPSIKVIVGTKVLKEGTDYIVEHKTETEPTSEKTLKVTVTGINGYTGSISDYVAITKKNLANCDITVKNGVVTVMNGKVVVPSSEYTVSQNEAGDYVITAVANSKYYTGTAIADGVNVPDTTVLRVTDRTTSTVSLAWDEVDGAEGYTIWFRSEYDTKVSRKIIQGGDVTSWKQNGLQPGTKYFYTVRAWVKDSEDNYVFGEQSPVQRGTTKPVAAAIKSVSSDNGYVKVVLAGKAAGAKMYSMCYSKSMNGFDSNDFKVGIRTSYTTRTFTKALSAGTYYVRVKSYRDLGNSKRVYGAWSNTMKVVIK